MRIELDSLPPQKRNSWSGSLDHNLEVFNGTEIHVNDRTTSPTMFKDRNSKGLKRCASNLITAREFAWSTSPTNRESQEGDANLFPTCDVRTFISPNHWIKDDYHTTNTSLVPRNESHNRNLRRWMFKDPATKNPVLCLDGDSSNDTCFRRLFPQVVHKNNSEKIETDTSVNLAPGPPMTHTMLQNTLYHEFSYYETKHIHTIPAPMPSRPQSQSIMIKGSPSQDESFRSNSAEQMYDWATWRMYHRITSARNSKAVAASNSCSNNSVPYSPAMMANKKGQLMIGHVVVDDSESEPSSMDYTLEGEVFEIDDI